MEDFEARLGSLLNDPAQMERIAGIARSIMGGEAPRPTEEPEPGLPDPAMLARIGSLVSRGSARSSRDKKLLEAMKPFLSEKRRGKMDKAMKLAELAGIAELAMTELGGGENDQSL